MDINNVIKINEIVSNYNITKDRYNQIKDELLSMKDRIADLELERAELFKTLTNIRLDEVNFLNKLKSDSPEEYCELMNRIRSSAIGKDEDVDK